MTEPIVELEAAFARYEALRSRLPRAEFPRESRRVPDLGALTDRYDVFALDAFGVLNVGERPIPGAPERVAALRAAGKRLFVLTNGATHRRVDALRKYGALGFDFTGEEVVSSRDLAAEALRGDGRLWAAAAGPAPRFGDLDLRVGDLLAEDALHERADGFLLLSASGWNRRRQDRLVAALRERPRRVVCANPDLVAPREAGLTLEPGWWAHDLADRTGVEPDLFGKPYGGAFAAIRARCPETPPERIVMVGDTLHTDILGGRAAGFAAALVLGHGLLAGREPTGFVARSGIVPDWLCETT